MSPADPPAPDADRPASTLEHLRWTERPTLSEPVFVIAFEGWNDAGDAATTAVRHLAREWDARAFASIDPEVFYDFTTTRPHVRFNEQGHREIVWPENIMARATVQSGLDVITLVGTEPQLRWRTFCEQIVGLAQQLGVRLVVTVGALLTEVPHTRPTPVYGTAYDDEVTEDLGLVPSRYEGPTGIVGVLHAACADAGLPSASLWAAVPTYVPSAPSPKAAMALVERSAALLETSVSVGDLTAETAAYEEHISELVEADEESRDYVRQLEHAFDTSEDGRAGFDALLDDPDALVQEVERFLRDHRD